MKHIGVFGNPLARLLLFFLFSIGWIALANSGAPAQNIYRTDDGHPFQVNVSCPETGLMSGEDIPLIFELRNLSDKPLFLSEISPGEPDSPPFYTYIRALADDDYLYHSPRFTLDRGIKKIQIQPGECFRTQIQLGRSHLKRHLRAEGQKTGRYAVIVQTKLCIGASDSKSKPPIPIVATTEIDVSPSNPETRGKVLEQLGEIIVTGRQTAATRAVDRLVVIEDLRVLSIFFRFLDVCDARTTDDGKLPSNFEPIVERVVIAIVWDYQNIFPDGGQVDEFLQRMKNSRSHFIRKRFADELDWMPNFSSLQAPPSHFTRFHFLLEMYRDPASDIRAIVAGRIGSIPGPEAERVLREMLEDADKTVREKARRSLDYRQK